MSPTEITDKECHSYYLQYIALAEDAPILESLATGLVKTIDFFDGIPSEKLDYRYEEGKWTPKEILQHIIDTERVFAYRALFIARSKNTNLVGFDQDEFANSVQVGEVSLEALIEEYISVRTATITLFKSFSASTAKDASGIESETLLKQGIASNSILSVRAAGYIIGGHEVHHCKVIQEKYL